MMVLDTLWYSMAFLSFGKICILDILPMKMRLKQLKSVKQCKSQKLKHTMSEPIKREARTPDYGDFSEEEVDRLVEEYCDSVKRGSTGWGVSFKDWLWLHGIAEHVRFVKLKRIKGTTL